LWRTNKLGRVLKHSTLNNYNSALKRVFKIAPDRGWIHNVPVPEIKNNGEKGKTALTLLKRNM
jgi:hypothetical protein